MEPVTLEAGQINKKSRVKIPQSIPELYGIKNTIDLKIVLGHRGSPIKVVNIRHAIATGFVGQDYFYLSALFPAPSLLKT